VAGPGFRLVGARTLAEAAFLRMDRLHLAGPDGEAVARIVVRHPGAVAVVPLLGDDVVLIEQFRAPVGRRLLEIPAGKLDVPGEDPEATARRELVEEVGVVAERLDHLATILTTPGFSDERIAIYRAAVTEGGDPALVGAEERDARIVRMSVTAALAAVRAGRIADAKTMIGLFLAAGS